MIQINPLKSYIDGGVRAALTTPPSASLVFDLPGKAIWVKGVKLKGTDHTYTFSHDNYITLTNTPDSNESEDIKIGVNTSALKSAIDTTYGVVSTTANGLAPKFTSGNKLAAAAATTYYFLGWAGSTLKWYQAPFRNIRINSETTDCLGVNNTDPLIISSGNGISVTWDSTNKKIIITNTKPDINHNTDTKVALSVTTLNKNYAIILKGNDSDEGSITTVNFSTYLKFNPSTKQLTINGNKVITSANTFVGATTSADGSVGLVTKPLIANRLLFLRGDGTWATPIDTWRPVKVEGTEKLGSNALDLSAGNGISIIYNSDTKKIIITNTKPDVNHNTHYTTMLYIGENNDTKANKNIANPYLKLFDDNTRRATFQIKAGNGIAVASDANGNITITNSSPDVNHNTDITVKQTPKTDNVNRPIMMINGSTSTGEQINTSMFSTGIYANASTKMITANGFIKAGSSNNYVLLGDGGHKAESSLSVNYASSAGSASSATQATNLRPENTAHYFRDPTSSTWRGGMFWGSNGNESMSFVVAHVNTRFQFVGGSDIANWTSSTWQNVTPYLTIYSSGIVTPGSVTATNGFIKSGSSNSYVLLGGGGHKALSDFSMSGHNHDGKYLRKDTNDSTPYQYTFTKTNDHAIRVGTVRGTAVGSQTGEYIHLYERVAIGSPSGWGSRPAPSYGLATYGGAWLATDTGNVTIGGTNQLSSAWGSFNLTVGNNTNKVVIGYLNSSTNGVVVGGHNNALSAWAPLNIAGTTLYFRINETIKATIDSNGNVGIGITSPAYKLHVNGTLGVTNITTFNINNQWLTPSIFQIGRTDTSTNASKAIIGVTDGNLHIDSYHGHNIYLNYYNRGQIRLGYQSGSYYISENGSYYNGTAASANSVAWGNVTGKPSTFTPSSHTHSYLPLSGGTMTGPIKFSYNNNGNCNVSRTSGFSMFYGNQENATNYGFPFRYSSVISFMTEYCGMQFANYGGTGDTRLLFRNISGDNTWTNWYHILHSGNSSVTKSGQTITVTINGTSQSLTNSTYNFSGASFTSGNYNTAEHNANNITSNGVWYYTSNGPTTSLGASTNDGALYSQAYNTNWVGQIALDYRNGNLFVRGKNNGTWQAWRGICWSDNYALRFHYSNLSNSPTYLWATNSNGYSFLAARGSISVNYANSAGSASTVTVNSSDANSTYRMVWHSGNTLYGTNNIYCNPNSDQIYSAGFRHVSYNSASYLLRSDGGVAAFNWSGQGGQPTWLWGGNSQHTYYVYNPSNFNVNSAAKLRVVSCYNGTTNNDLWSTIKSSNSSYLGTSTMYEVYNDGGPTTYGHILDTVTVHSNHWQSQLWMAAGKGGRLYYRNKDYNNNTWGSWGTVAWTSDIPTVTNYYWANVKVSASSSTGTSPTFQECYANGWFRSTGNNGWYNPTHGSHIHPNGTTTYGNLVVRGAKSGYTGINLGNSTSHMTVMSTDTHHGLYCDKYGWEFYFNRSNGGVGIRTSSITKNFNVSGQSYLSSNVWIGTTSGGEMLNVGGWVGTVGNNGWYSITHAGGWYMTDANWIRTYNKKGIYTDIGTIYNLGHAHFACYNGYNVGIGTTSPSYKLHVSGDSYTSGWNRAGSGFYCQSYGTHYYGNANKDAIIYTETLNVINFETTNTSGRFWINYRAPISGHSAVNQFHFGASTGGGYGTLYALHYYESSDIRYKHNITTLNITSEKLSTLPLFNFVWDQTKGLPGWHTGTSAQEVVKILPNIISGDNSFLTLDYGVLGTIAGITACKELVTLKSELLQLKEKVKLLEDKLRKYENI